MLFLGFVLKPIQSIPGGKWIYIVCIIVLLWGFALFTGGSPSVIRAVSMFTGFALAKYSHRIHSAFHLLVVSFFLLLVFYPPPFSLSSWVSNELSRCFGHHQNSSPSPKALERSIPCTPKILGNHHRVLGRSNCSHPLKCFLFPSISGFVPPFQLAYPSLFWLVFDREYGLGGPYCTEY